MGMDRGMPPIWFIGHEESGGDVPEEVAEKTNYFYKVHAPTNATLCDILELYRQVAVRRNDSKAGLFTNRCEFRFGKNALQNGFGKISLYFSMAIETRNFLICSNTRNTFLHLHQKTMRH